MTGLDNIGTEGVMDAAARLRDHCGAHCDDEGTCACPFYTVNGCMLIDMFPHEWQLALKGEDRK